MKNYFTLIAFFFAAAAQGQSWQPLAAFPDSARDDGACFTVANAAFCGSGFATGWVTRGDFYRFDMASESWSVIPSLPAGEARQYACGFSDDVNGFIFGGLDAGGNFLNDLWLYDPQSSGWLAQTALPGAGRSGSAVFTLDSMAYIIGGMLSGPPNLQFTDEVWAYNMNSGNWTQKNNFPFGQRWRASGAALNGRGYLLFGKDSSGSSSRGLYAYDPQADAWSFISFFPGTGRTYGSLTAAGSQLFVFAGIDSAGVYYNDLWSYSFSPGQWAQQASLPAAARKGGMAFTNGVTLYYTTGIDAQNNRLAETWKISSPSSLPEHPDETAVAVYPNPASDEVTIELPLSLRGKETVLQVYDSRGRLVLQEDVRGNAFRFGVSALGSGIYLVRLRSAAGLFTTRLAVAGN